MGCPGSALRQGSERGGAMLSPAAVAPSPPIGTGTGGAAISRRPIRPRTSSSVLKFQQLEEAVEKEDGLFRSCRAEESYIAEAAASKDAVAGVMSELKNGVEEER